MSVGMLLGDGLMRPAAGGSTPPSGPELVTVNLLADWDPHLLAQSNSSDITGIPDTSGHAHDTTAPGGHLPVYRTGMFGTRDGAHFSGDQILKTTDSDFLPIGTDPRSIFMVFRCDNTTPPAAGMLQYGPNGSTNGFVSVGISDTLGHAMKAYYWNIASDSFAVANIDQAHAVCWRVNSEGKGQWWIDGVPQTADSFSVNSFGGTVISLGGNGNSNNGEFIGTIGRWLCHGTLSDEEIGDQFAYLQDVYGTPVGV